VNFKLNEEFLYIKKGDNLHIVSIYPDHDEIYKFSGKVVPLLEICFREKYISRKIFPSATPHLSC